MQAATDNLIKGGAGQAIQNMNLMLGLPETLSLEDPGRVALTMATAVIKLGGDVLEDPARAEVARGVSACARAAPGRTGSLVVHGGGAQVTALSGRLGVETRLVGGRRITDAATLEVLEMVVAGRLNVELCAALRAQAVRAVGLHAGSGVLRARKRPPRVVSGGGPDPIDFGLVGDVVGIDRPLLDALWAAGYLPVVSCLGLSDDGQVLNLNADLAASQMAAALEADTLVAVTAVGGVRRDPRDPGHAPAHASRWPRGARPSPTGWSPAA